jgi:hypothetical protein
MSRRYLSLGEAESAVVSGRSVECFLGKCQRGDAIGVRWLSVRLSADKNCVELCRYDTADLGTPEYLDLYEFGPLDPALQQDEADETLKCEGFSDLWPLLEQRFPGSTARLVNQGVVQDEYYSYKVKGDA